MNIEKISQIATFLPKSKIKAGEANEKGKYIFFTSSDTNRSYIDKYLYDDELLIIGTGGFASCNYYNGKFSVSTDNFVIKPNNNLLAKYLYYFLRKDNLFILQNGFRGTGLKHISKEYVSNIAVPIFALDKQKSIVGNLDAINDSIKAEKQRIIRFNELIKSRFNELFSSCNFAKEKLDSLTIKITDGSHNPPKGISKSNYIMASSQNIFDTLDLANVRYLSKEDFIIENKRTNIQEGDLLFTIVGTIGRSYVVKDEKMVFQRSVAVIKPKHNLINSIYLKYFLSSQDGMDQINKMAHGVAQKGIYLSDLKKILIKVPDIDKQNIFESFVSLIDKLKFNCQQRIKLYQELLDKKMDEYFG